MCSIDDQNLPDVSPALIQPIIPEDEEEDEQSPLDG